MNGANIFKDEDGTLRYRPAAAAPPVVRAPPAPRPRTLRSWLQLRNAKRSSLERLVLRFAKPWFLQKRVTQTARFLHALASRLMTFTLFSPAAAADYCRAMRNLVRCQRIHHKSSPWVNRPRGHRPTQEQLERYGNLRRIP